VGFFTRPFKRRNVDWSDAGIPKIEFRHILTSIPTVNPTTLIRVQRLRLDYNVGSGASILNVGLRAGRNCLDRLLRPLLPGARLRSGRTKPSINRLKLPFSGSGDAIHRHPTALSDFQEPHPAKPKNSPPAEKLWRI